MDDKDFQNQTGCYSDDAVDLCKGDTHFESRPSYSLF
jgi:hypothetical protein